MALDGLRGYAALSVALGHSVLAITGLDLWSKSVRDFSSMTAAEVGYRLLSLIAPSGAAVMLFFVLSGHVLWMSFVRKNLMVHALPDYLFSRAMRLFPLIIVTTIIIGVLKGASLHDIVLTALLWDTSLNGVLWSLQVEVIGSVMIVLVWLLCKNSTYKLLIALAVTFAIVPFARGTPLVYLPAFVLGALIDGIPPTIWRKRIVFGAGITLLVGSNVILGHAHANRLFEMLGAMLVVGCMGAFPISALQTSFSRFLGAISYPFYLVHLIGAIVASAGIAAIATLAPLAQIALFAFISITVAIPIAWLLHEAVEVPTMSLHLPRYHQQPG
jgi:peptidoglycan/LPS O-acetylase OafA/YrhL